jgi:hypothetical protein
MAKTQTPPPALGDEIAALLKAEGRSAADVAAMLDRVGPEVDRLRTRAGAVRDDALNPRLTWAEVQALRAAADEADFEAARIERAAEVLAADLDKLQAAEAETDRRARYSAADARAAEVAELVRLRYPALAADLLKLIEQVVDATREVVAVNRDLPAGFAMLRGPEDRARGVNMTAGTRPERAPMLLAEAVLPPFTPSDRAIWPRETPNSVGTIEGVKRGTAMLTFSPYGVWPHEAQVASAWDDLEASMPKALAAE